MAVDQAASEALAPRHARIAVEEKGDNMNRFAAVAVLTFCVAPAHAIPDLRITAQSTNVILSWPSAAGQTFVVQFRPDLQPETLWVTFANSYPAAAGTNRTTFTHLGGFVPATPCGGGGGGGSGGPPSPLSVSPLLVLGIEGPVDATTETSAIVDRPTATSETVIVRERRNHPWPPLPPPLWPLLAPEERAHQETMAAEAAALAGISDSPHADGPLGGPSCGVSTGFYRVVRTGLNLVNTPSSASGTVALRFELGIDPATDPLAGARLFANGNEAHVYDADLANTTLTWNTGFMTNGTYSINLLADLNFSSITSAVKTISLSNMVVFSSLQSMYGDRLWVYARLAIQQAVYEIDMYGESNDYIGTFSGSTGNGIISFAWDLTDPQGNPRTDMSFTGQFFVAAAGAPLPSTPSGVRTWNGEAWWLDGGMVIAWAALNNNAALTLKLEDMVLDGVVNIVNYSPLSGGNVPLGSAFQLSGQSRAALMSELASFNYRDFYYFGHGTASAIGAFNDPQSIITHAQIRTNLGNWLGMLMPVQTNVVNNHPYRFVWLDGCETGKGTFCEAFGIEHFTLDLGYYRTYGLVPRAFLGFKTTTTTNPHQTGFRAAMMAQFFNDWQMNNTLYYCVTNAAHHPTYPLPSSWVIYGATDLRRMSP
jgi:hypothetical protein